MTTKKRKNKVHVPVKKMRNSNLDIFIYSHIPFRPYPKDKVFKVLTNSHADSKVFDTDLKIYRDYNGEDNLSAENIMYNEYSGFYWIWKNYPIKKYIGMNHYRRYYGNCNNLPDVGEIFRRKKIILNKPIPLRVHDHLPRGGEYLSNREWYAYWHNIEDFELLEKIIKRDYPQYSDGWDKMAKCDYLYGCSMFIMDKDTFNTYCEYIFDVLKKVRDELNLQTKEDCIKYVENNKSKYIKPGLNYYTVEIQSRIVGYLAERALGAFLMSGGENSLENNAEIWEWGMIPKEYYQVDQNVLWH